MKAALAVSSESSFRFSGDQELQTIDMIRSSARTLRRSHYCPWTASTVSKPARESNRIYVRLTMGSR